MPMTNPDGFERTWNPMRPWLTCPHCQRRGAVQRRIGVKPFITHHCPGPFVLDHVEKTSNPTRAGFNLTIFPAGPFVGFGGDYEPPEGGEHHVRSLQHDRGREGEGLGRGHSHRPGREEG